jgi:hypothetical protein
MLRSLCALAIIAATGCGPHTGVAPPLVEPPPTPLPAVGQLSTGEEMVWDIYWEGLLVGSADLTVADTKAQSSFSTTTLARAFANVNYHLVTTLERGVARASRENVHIGGEDTSTVATLAGTTYAIDDGPRLDVPGGTALHTLHTALGSLRTWSRGDAPPAYLWFVLRHTLYRLDVERPTRGEAQDHRALEIHGVVRALDRSIDPIVVTIWLSASPDRTPLRFVVVAGGERVSAELTETTSTFAAR